MYLVREKKQKQGLLVQVSLKLIPICWDSLFGTIDDGIYVITVVYTERNEAIRIISARYGTEKERKTYYEYSQRDWFKGFFDR